MLILKYLKKIIGLKNGSMDIIKNMILFVIISKDWNYWRDHTKYKISRLLYQQSLNALNEAKIKRNNTGNNSRIPKSLKKD